MSFFDTVSRIIQQGKDMVSNAQPANAYSYTKPKPVVKTAVSPFVSNPLLLANPIKKQAPQQPVFAAPQKVEAPLPKVNTANTTPQQTDQTMVDTAKGIIQGGKYAALKTGGFAKDVFQSTPRAALATTQYVGELAKGTPAEEARNKAWQASGATNILSPIFGKRPVSIQSEGVDPLKSLGVSPENAAKFGAPFVFGTLALDAFTGGSSKAGRKLVEESLELSKDTIIKRLGEQILVKPDGVRQPSILGTDKDTFIEALKKSKKPSAAQVNEGLELLRLEGKQTDDIRKTLADAYKAPAKKEVVKEESPKQYPGLKSQGGYIKNPLAAKGTPPQTNNQVVSSGNDSMDTYIQTNISNREKARGTPSFYSKLKEVAGETGKKFVDYTLPISKAVEKGKKEDPFFRAFIEQNPSKDVNNQIDRVLRAPTIATQFIKDNGLSQVVKEVENLDEFDEYLIASHAIDVDARGINTGRNVKKDEQIVRYLAPKYEKQARVVRAYSQKLLDEATNAGLVSKETAVMLKERYPNYVPLNRIFDEAELANQRVGNGKGVASLSKQTVVRKLEGSNREIESPVRSLYERTNSAVLQIEKNQAAKLIGSYKDLKGNPFHLTEITEVGEAAKDMGTITFLDNGVKRVFETTPEIADAAKALNTEQLNILVRILAVPTRLLRLGATGVNTAFLGANIVKDQISAFIMADRGMRASIANPNNFLRGLWSAVGRDEMYDEWIRAGGGGTAYDLGRNQIKSTVERDRAKRTLVSRTINAGKNPLRTVEDLFARAEEITRLQQYRAARNIAAEKGLSNVDATTAGAKASRENSTNFARRGEWGSVLNATIPYFGASIQGSRLLVRNLKNKPLQTSTKIATTLLFPTAVATYWNMSDPIRKEVYDDIQDYEKEGNIILVPHNPIKDEQGRWEVIKIPLPPGVGQLTNLVRRPIEQTYGLDKVKFSEVAKALVKTVSPVDVTSGRGVLSSLTPQIIKPSLESVTNTNLFTGKPIVYQNEAMKPKEEQVREYTSGTARLIAKGLGTSPIKTEAFIGSAGAGVAKNALNLSDKALAALGIIPKDQIGGIGIGESVSRRFTSAAGNKYRAGSKELDKALEDEETKRKETSTRLSNSLTEFKDLSPEEQTAKLKELAQTDKEYAIKLRDKLREENKKKTWSDVDRGIAQLGVENKARATYVYKKMQELPSDQRNSYIKDLHDRKVISDDVLKQIKVMHKENAIIE